MATTAMTLIRTLTMTGDDVDDDDDEDDDDDDDDDDAADVVEGGRLQCAL